MNDKAAVNSMVTKHHSQYDIVLASASPRREALLKQIGWRPIILPVDIDEKVAAEEVAVDYCLRMAEEKSIEAQKCMPATSPIKSLPIITADTIVVVDDQILGKPQDQQDAVLTLHKLSGREHQVYSSVSVSYISEAEIAAYVATGEPMDKAGAYGIQGYAAMWIESITGSYSSIMGLPLFETTVLLRELGIMSALELSALENEIRSS